MAYFFFQGLVDLQQAEGIHSGVVQLVLSERSSGPIAEGLFLANLLFEDFFADERQVAVSLFWVDSLEELVGIDDIGHFPA